MTNTEGGNIFGFYCDFHLMLVNSAFKGEVKVNIEVANYALKR